MYNPGEEITVKTELGRCWEHLNKAVKYFALSSGTAQEKLSGLTHGAPGFHSISAEDFPNGQLKTDFRAIESLLKTDSQPKIQANVDTLSEDEARSVIASICDLYDGVTRAVERSPK
jgi:hypothetical protein